MDILLYLSELVQTRKVIGISGLGTIYKKKSPGRYDLETHSFLPPSYVLEFTEELKEEILLPELISKKRDITTATAIYFINEFSEMLHQRLKVHGEADLGTLGKLKSIDGKLTFEPARGLEFGFDFYGLPSIKAEPPYIEEATEEERSDLIVPTDLIIPTDLPTPTAASEIETVTETDGVQEDPALAAVIEDNKITETNPGDADAPIEPFIKEEKITETELLNAKIEALSTYRIKTTAKPLTTAEQEEVIWNLNEPKHLNEQPVNQYHTLPDVPPDTEVEKTMSVTVKILIAVAFLIIAIAALYFIKPDLFSGITGNAPQQTGKLTGSPDSGSLAGKDTVGVKNTVKAGTATTPSATVKPSAPVQTAAIVNPADSLLSYEIIGASVLNQKEADYFIYQMKKSGITAKALAPEPGKKRLKMSLATFKDKAAAELELKKLEEKLKIKGIYIYRNKQQ